MAEIINDKDSGAPQGDFEGGTEGKSQNGTTFYYRAVDSEGNTVKQERGQAHQVGASRPSFSYVSCDWPPETSGNVSPDFAKETIITWYKLAKTVGWTYQLTISCTDTYNYTFLVADGESLDLSVWQTWSTHEVTYTTTGDPTIVAVSGN